MMKTQTTFATSALLFLALAAPALAQDEDMFELPEQCSDMPVSEMSDTETWHDMMDHGPDHDMGMSVGDEHDGMMPDHVRENMQRMLLTMPAMRQGMMQEDPDIAFACGMIAHHQAAIDMARVVLDHGQDADMRRLAEEIIEVQHEEIEYMKQWLEASSS
ncbi:CopM family metallochaperone [Roseivivax sediminis]|uniref:DUF305 domain-containing protein n=1 Tax=Roseivivax sediminis TaxID=936889 RepID=A0A1I2E9N6_9RHOB|nr:DUF305 domain-containing protein [Roseivivax sediminis]SFE89306.1 protein of unknown function [Roseivivax sediminis]